VEIRAERSTVIGWLLDSIHNFSRATPDLPVWRWLSRKMSWRRNSGRCQEVFMAVGYLKATETLSKAVNSWNMNSLAALYYVRYRTTPTKNRVVRNNAHHRRGLRFNCRRSSCWYGSVPCECVYAWLMFLHSTILASCVNRCGTCEVRWH
jgi:hypothetical protein